MFKPDEVVKGTCTKWICIKTSEGNQVFLMSCVFLQRSIAFPGDLNEETWQCIFCLDILYLSDSNLLQFTCEVTNGLSPIFEDMNGFFSWSSGALCIFAVPNTQLMKLETSEVYQISVDSSLIVKPKTPCNMRKHDIFICSDLWTDLIYLLK